MSSQIFGYCRISDQTPLEHQLIKDKLESFDLAFIETCEIDDNKIKLSECLIKLSAGDIVYFESFASIAKNVTELKNILNDLLEKNVTVKFLKEDLTFDDTTKNVLQYFDLFARFEEDVAIDRGPVEVFKKSGRSRKLSKEQIKELKKRIINGEDKNELCKEYGITHATLYKYVPIDDDTKRKMGRRRTLTPEKEKELKERLKTCESKTELAKEFGISLSTLYSYDK